MRLCGVSRWREAICTKCLWTVSRTNGFAFLVMVVIALLLWAYLRSPMLIAGVAITITGVMIHEFIVALRWHRHD